MKIEHANEMLHLSDTNLVVVLDTNILIQTVDTSHRYHAQTLKFMERLRNGRTNVRMIYLLAAKIELAEYLRKRFYTTWLVGTFTTGNDIFGGSEFDQYCMTHEFVEKTPRPDEMLTDRGVKDLRHACFRSFDTEKQGLANWERISQLALNGRFNSTEKLLARLDIHYKGLQDKELFPKDQIPKWRDQEALIRKFGLGAADAAILNMVNANSNIGGLMTNDSDFITIFRSQLVRSDVRCFTFIRGFLTEHDDVSGNKGA